MGEWEHDRRGSGNAVDAVVTKGGHSGGTAAIFCPRNHRKSGSIPGATGMADFYPAAGTASRRRLCSGDGASGPSPASVGTGIFSCFLRSAGDSRLFAVVLARVVAADGPSRPRPPVVAVNVMDVDGKHIMFAREAAAVGRMVGKETFVERFEGTHCFPERSIAAHPVRICRRR